MTAYVLRYINYKFDKMTKLTNILFRHIKRVMTKCLIYLGAFIYVKGFSKIRKPIKT